MYFTVCTLTFNVFSYNDDGFQWVSLTSDPFYSVQDWFCFKDRLCEPLSTRDLFEAYAQVDAVILSPASLPLPTVHCAYILLISKDVFQLPVRNCSSLWHCEALQAIHLVCWHVTFASLLFFRNTFHSKFKFNVLKFWCIDDFSVLFIPWNTQYAL